MYFLHKKILPPHFLLKDFYFKAQYVKNVIYLMLKCFGKKKQVHDTLDFM